jgi:hypothetical protein
MHYEAYAFAVNRAIPTMVAKNGKKNMGNEKGFSTVGPGSSFSYQSSPI